MKDKIINHRLSKTGKQININPKYITDDIYRSAKRWLEIKQAQYRNYCPFLLQLGGCNARCGAILKDTVGIIGKECVASRWSDDEFREIVEAICAIYDGTYVDKLYFDLNLDGLLDKHSHSNSVYNNNQYNPPPFPYKP